MAKEPRTGDITIGGYPWMARMIDKARLEKAGEIDEFDLDYPCPMDQSLLKKLSIDSRTFQAIAVANESDDAILSALKEAGAKVS